jgi:hypothetical protein
LDYTNLEWQANLTGARTYLYPIHPAGGFMQAGTLAATLHLFLVRFLACHYEEAFALCPACFTDQPLTSEEGQLIRQLATLADDHHPDAAATRLRFAAVAGHSLTWNTLADLTLYVERFQTVSAACRLPLEDEEQLLDQLMEKDGGLQEGVGGEGQNYGLYNHASALRVVASHMRMKRPLREINREVSVRTPPHLDIPIFDETSDRTCLDPKASKQKDDSLFAKLWAGTYVRPEPDRLAGEHGLRKVFGWLEGGLKLKTAKEVGFPMIYDLLTGQAMMRVLPFDDSHNWGSLLLHLYPPEMFTRKGLHMSLLRALAHNPSVCMEAPVLEVEEKKGLQKLFSVDGNLAALPRRAASFLQTRSALHWPPAFTSRFVPPKAVMLRSGHAWLAPCKIANTSCDRRVIHLPLSGTYPRHRPVVVAEAMLACTSTPLSHLAHLVANEAGGGVPSDGGGGRLPFDLSAHSMATSVNAAAVLQRMEEDYRLELAVAQNKQVATLKGFEVVGGVPLEGGGASVRGQNLFIDFERAGKAATAALEALELQAQADRKATEAAKKALLAITGKAVLDLEANQAPTLSQMKLALAQAGGRAPTITLEVMVALLMSSSGAEELMALSPLLTHHQAQWALEQAALTLLAGSRLAQSLRCRTLLLALLDTLGKHKTAITHDQDHLTSRTDEERASAWKQCRLMASQAAQAILAQRHYVRPSGSKDGQTAGDLEGETAALAFDPRYLVFEFVHNILLRKEQVQLVDSFVATARGNRSVCHQMLMGGGKTTVVAPLVALMLAEGGTLPTLCVPASLLQFAQSVLRATYVTSALHRRVLTLSFSRYTKATPELADRLEKARQMGSIVLSPPGSLKSLFLKFLECAHLIDATARGEKEGLNKRKGGGLLALFGGNLKEEERKAAMAADLLTRDAEKELRREMQCLVRVFRLFKEGVLLLDEVDLLLHPLRSELHWPLGLKLPLDFTQVYSHRLTSHWSPVENIPTV